MPRFLQRASDPRQIAGILEDVLGPYRDEPATRVPVRVAMGRAWLEARDADRALALAHEGQRLDETAPGPALLAMELMRERPQAEALVLHYLGRPDAEPALRLAYVRQLTAAQRYADAVAQLETITRLQPELAPPFLSLGALHLELKQTKQGEAALERYIDLVQRQAATAPSASAATDAEPDDDDVAAARPDQGLVQAWLMLAQSAEQRGDFKAAEAWLAKVDDPRRALEVQTRRASILARQGQLQQARELIRRTPERSAEDQRAKFVAEAGVLREVKHWREAFEVLGSANQRFADDADLMYEQAMMAEKIDRLDEMERLLRRVIEIKPDNAHAHNALGYSLADRGQRLPEARLLIARALELSPGDPFITDSLGWVEFRLGNAEEALRLLQRAYAARPDPEIGAHLGEVLWAQGRRDEARRVWLEAKGRDVGQRRAARDAGPLARRPVIRRALALLAVSLLAACATPPPTPGEPVWTSGRISIRIAADASQAAQSISVAFELRGDGQSGELRLNSPLGMRVAQARWAPGVAVLDTPEGERSFDTLDELSRQTLGEALPLAALPDWIAGRPWPAAPHRVQEGGFEQLGWSVRLARQAEGWIDARREAPPEVVVRVRLDREASL